MVLSLPLTEGSAKVRTGGAKDDPDDLPLPIWAGVLPLRLVSDPAIPTEPDDHDLPVPEHVSRWRRPAPAKERLPRAPAAGEPEQPIGPSGRSL